jgi:hypothetical protein
MQIVKVWHKRPLVSFLSLAFILVLLLLGQTARPVFAAVGTNQQLSFTGKVVRSDGTNIADGTYNMEFKIYQDGNSSGSGSTLQWTEDYLFSGSTGMPSTGGITLTSGTFQVNLGSICALGGGTCGAKTNTGVDFNQQTLWLSMQIGNSTACTVTSSTTSFALTGAGNCNGDGEMTPYIRLTAVPQALNADKLDGLDSTGFILNQTSPQSSSNFNISGNGVIGGSLTATSVVTAALDTASAVTLNIGSTSSGISLNKDTTLAAGKSLIVTGGTSRPSSPTKGQLFFDTSSGVNHLIQYNGSAWVSAPKTATEIVAANDSSQSEKDAADYVATGTGDQSTINTALSALPASGGIVYLMEGHYYVTASVSLPDNATLAGSGQGSIIIMPNGQNGSYHMVTNTNVTNGIVFIRDLAIDGNASQQTGGNPIGIYLDGVGSSTAPGGSVKNVRVKNIHGNSGSAAVWLNSSYNVTVSGSALDNNQNFTIYLNSATDSQIVNNKIQGSPVGIQSSGSKNVISNNVVDGANTGISVGDSGSSVTGNSISNSYNGIWVFANSTTITGNSIYAASSNAIYLNGSNNAIAANKIIDSGGSTTNNAIYLTAATANTISGNDITDSACSSDCYAINISDIASTGNLLSANHLTATETINDASTGQTTGTLYQGQAITANGDSVFRNSTNSSTAFQIQNAAGTAYLTGNSSSSTVSVTNLTVTSSATISTLDSGSSILSLGSTVTTLQKSAAAFTLDVHNGNTDSTLTISNGGGSGNIKLALDSGGTFAIGATNGTTISACSANNYISSFASTGGIITGGSCGTIASSNLSDTANIPLLNAANTFTPSNSANALRLKNGSGTAVFNISTTDSTGNNLVSNPSFESALSGWSAINSATAPAQSTAQVFEGSDSLLIATGTNASGGGGEYNGAGTLLSASTAYTMSVMVKTDSTQNVATFEMGYNTNGSAANDVSCLTAQVLTGNGWKRFTCSFITSGGTTTGSSVYFKQTDAVNRNIYLDDLVVQTDANATSEYHNATLDLTGTNIQSPLVLKDGTNEANAFQIQNSSGVQIFNVDTSDTNLISNPGFEINTTGWSLINSATALVRDTTKTYSGVASGKFTTTSTANSGVRFTFANQLTSGNYVISFFAMTSAADASLNAGFNNGASDSACTGITPTPSATVPSTTGWTRFSCTVSSSAISSIYITSGTTAITTFNLDAVEVDSGTTPPPYGAGVISFNAIIATPVNVQNVNNSTTAFQVLTSGGATLLSVDTLNSQVTLGGVSAASGALSGIATINMSGQLTSTVSTGTAPFVVSSTTQVSNLNVSQLQGATWASPAAIGSTTAAAGTFTSLTVNTANGLTLGIASSANGGLVFKNSSNANTITIQTGATASSITITLPAITPAASSQQADTNLPFVANLIADSAASSSTTLADITASGNANDALSLTIPAGATVKFQLNIIYTIATNASNTIIVGWKCSNASQSSLASGFIDNTAATGATVASGGTTTACGTTAANILAGATTGTLTTPLYAQFSGTVKANAGAATTLTFEYARSGAAGSTTVKAGSYVTWWQ